MADDCLDSMLFYKTESFLGRQEPLWKAFYTSCSPNGVKKQSTCATHPLRGEPPYSSHCLKALLLQQEFCPAKSHYKPRGFTLPHLDKAGV